MDGAFMVLRHLTPILLPCDLWTCARFITCALPILPSHSVHSFRPRPFRPSLARMASLARCLQVAPSCSAVPAATHVLFGMRGLLFSVHTCGVYNLLLLSPLGSRTRRADTAVNAAPRETNLQRTRRQISQKT